MSWLKTKVVYAINQHGVQALRGTVLVKYNMLASQFISIYGKIGYHLTRTVQKETWFLTQSFSY